MQMSKLNKTQVPGSVTVAFKLPYPATIHGNTLIVSVPVRDFGALFTDNAVESTEILLGKREAADLLDTIAERYYRQLVILQMTETDVPADNGQLDTFNRTERALP